MIGHVRVHLGENLNGLEVVYHVGTGALPAEDFVRGLAVGAALMVGAFVAKPFVLRLAPETFRFMMDGLLAISGTCLVWNGLG